MINLIKQYLNKMVRNWISFSLMFVGYSLAQFSCPTLECTDKIKDDKLCY